MIRNITSKFVTGGSLRTVKGRFTVRTMSTQRESSGKEVVSGWNAPKPKPKPTPVPSVPFPSDPTSPAIPTPHLPMQTPIIEIPGPIPEPALPQQSPITLPPTEIPAPTRNTENQANKETDADEVLIENVNDGGIITLHRPKALNALNLSMVRKIYPVLKQWETTKKLVIVKGSGQKAFCAGGDVKSLVIPLDHPGGEKVGQDFFRNEYTLNHLIGTYKIPYVALINGITMGGGVGLSVHGKFRIATENTVFAMPETAIGLFPDVGGTYFLPRLEGQLGLYLGLTGDRLKGVDVLQAGIATHFVPADRLEDLTKALLEKNSTDISEIIRKYQPENLNNEFILKPYLKQIDDCFSAPTVEEIISRLESDGSEFAKKTLKTLEKMSPMALKVTKLAIEKGSKQSLAECLKMEYRLAFSVLRKDYDFYEGVRALLIDKDQKPVWNPKSLKEVTENIVAQRFADLPADQELKL